MGVTKIIHQRKIPHKNNANTKKQPENIEPNSVRRAYNVEQNKQNKRPCSGQKQIIDCQKTSYQDVGVFAQFIMITRKHDEQNRIAKQCNGNAYIY